MYMSKCHTIVQLLKNIPAVQVHLNMQMEEKDKDQKVEKTSPTGSATSLAESMIVIAAHVERRKKGSAMVGSVVGTLVTVVVKMAEKVALIVELIVRGGK